MELGDQFSQERAWRIQQAAVSLVFEALEDPQAKKFLETNDNAAYAASIIEHAIDYLENTVTPDDLIMALKKRLNEKQTKELIARLSALRKRV